MKLSARTGDTVRDIHVERRGGRFVVTVDGVEKSADAHKLDADFYSILMDGRSYEVSVEATGSTYTVRHGAAEQVIRLSDPSREAREELFARSGPAAVDAHMPGKVVRVFVSPGDEVAPGQGLLVIEAMKMENEIASPRGGKVVSVEVASGQTVEAGQRLVVLE